MTAVCNWHQYDDDYCSYETDCGQSFILTEGSPADNGMKFCCYCGKTLVGHPYKECEHENLQVIPDYEGYGPGEPHLTRRFTTYRCPDCDYEAESPPPGWEKPFEEPDVE